MDLQNAFFLVSGVSLVSAGTWLIYLFPSLGYVMVGFFCATAWSVPVWNPVVSAGGLAFTLPDLVCATLISVSMVELLNNRLELPGLLRWAPLLFILLMAFSLLRGVSSVGMATAANEARPWVLIFAISLWTLINLAIRDNGTALFRKWLFGTALVVIVVGAVNIFRYGLGGATTARRSITGEILEAGRPITSGQAMLVAAAALYLIYLWQDTRRPLYAWSAVVCAFCVLLAQHRSVWLAYLVGVGVVAFAASGVLRRVLVLFAAISSSLLFVVLNTGILGRYGELLTSSAGDTRTYDGRVYDWQVLIERSITRGADAVFFGMPLGSGWERFREDGALIRYIPHNWYVATYLRVGILGLALMAVVVIAIVVRASRTWRTDPTAVIVVSILVYCWSYNLQWYLAPLVGWAIYGVGRKRVDIRAMSRVGGALRDQKSGQIQSLI